jgi:DNA-binding NarL/FixJ family response regulator
MNRKMRLLIADEYRFVADACKQMLEPEFEVIDVVANGRDLVKSVLQFKPDAAILEVALPQLNGIQAARQLKQKLPALRLIFFVANSDVNVAAEAFRAGASAYLLKRSGAEEFVAAIRRVMRGESYLSPMIARQTIDYILRSSVLAKPDREITTRQSEILQLLAEGSSMKQVAAILGISSGTVAFHKYRMMERLGIENNAGLIQYAMKTNMTSSPAIWAFTDLKETTFVDVSHQRRSVLVSPRRATKGRLAPKAAARTWQRREDRNGTGIQ